MGKAEKWVEENQKQVQLAFGSKRRCISVKTLLSGWAGHKLKAGTRAYWEPLVREHEDPLAVNGADNQLGAGAPVGVWRAFAQAIIATDVINNARPLILPSVSDEHDEKDPHPVVARVALGSDDY